MWLLPGTLCDPLRNSNRCLGNFDQCLAKIDGLPFLVELNQCLLKINWYLVKINQSRSWVWLASHPGHVGGGKSGLVSTVCTCTKNPMISWGIVYHRLQTVNLYFILAYSSEAHPSRAYPTNIAGKSDDFDKALNFALLYQKGRFHVESRTADVIKCI